MSQIQNVVLVHGGFVDGSGWQKVHDLLTSDGYRVSVVQNPTMSLAGDVLATLRVVRAAGGPCVLVGHSYGGAVITEAGADEFVAALAYIAAFAPDAGESVASLIAEPLPIVPAPDGFLLLDRARFHAVFAADLPEGQARFMAASQVPWGADALEGAISRPAWRDRPCWYLVATEDRMFPPLLQRRTAERAGAAVREVAASHAVYLSQPQATAELIKLAAASAGS